MAKEPDKEIVRKTAIEEPDSRPLSELPFVQLSLVCPFCKSPLSSGKIVRCSACETKHHRDCWKEHGRCSVFNCTGKEEAISFSKKQIYATVAGILGAAVIIASSRFWLIPVGIEEDQRKNIIAPAQKPPDTPIQQPVPPQDCERNLTSKEKEQVHQMLEAARFGETNRVLSLIQSGTNINSKGVVSVFQTNDRCWTPLMMSAYYGHDEAVNTLIEAGAGIDIPDSFGYTALMLSVFGNSVDVVKRILRAHASVHTVNRFGDSPLSMSVIRGNEEIVQAILGAGADVNARNGLGYSPLIQSLRAKQFPIAIILLKAKADPNIADGNGKTALSWATELGNEEMVNALLNAGAYPNVKDAAGATPLMYATLVGKPEILRTLIRAGADVNALDARGSSALSYAKQNSRQDLIKILRESGAKD